MEKSKVKGDSEHNWVVILEVGSEGGAVWIYGRKTSTGNWRFKISSNSLAELSDDDGNEHWIAGNGPELVSWKHALAALNKTVGAWHMLYPTRVHPEFQGRVWDAYQSQIKRAADSEAGHPSGSDRWQEACGVPQMNPTETPAQMLETAINEQPDGSAQGLAPIDGQGSKPKIVKPRMPLTYDDPLTAVFVRTLAWEIHEAGRKPLVKELVANQVQTAREALGLERNRAGAPHAFIQSLRKHEPPLISSDPTEPLEKGWRDMEKAWRLYCLPSHRMVRMLSKNPIVIPCTPDNVATSGLTQFCLKLRSPTLPTLLVTVGVGRPNAQDLGASRGVYFLREAESLYIGQSDEFEIRWSGHKNKGVKWWVFIAPKDQQQMFSSDSLNAAEALLISLWNEVCVLSNHKRGKDKKPGAVFLQQAILLVEAASAAFLWLIREQKLELTPWNLPFKPFRARQGRHWPQCYLAPDNVNGS